MIPSRRLFSHHASRWTPALILAAGLLALSTMVTARADTFGAHPKMLDGMNSVERTRAMRSLQSEAAGRSSRPAGTVTAYSTASAADAQPQLILMERRREKGSSARHADAWYYSYAHNETIHKVVDLTSGEVISSEVVIGTQLPLVDVEITRAFDILLASSADHRTLGRAYKAVTGEDFEDRSQVSYKAFVFHPDTVVDGLTADARRCGVHRCAQLLIYTHDNIALDMSPVVDLSKSRVLQNLELRARAIVHREGAAR